MDARARIAQAIADAREVTARMQEHRASLNAAGLAFFVALSIAPAAIALGSIAGIVLEPVQVRDALTALAANSPGAAPLEGVIEPVVAIVESSSERAFGIATIVGGLIAAYAASRVVLGSRMALDAAFDRQPRLSGIAQRIAAAVITLVGILLAVAGIVALTVLPRLLRALGIDASAWVAAPIAGWVVVLIGTYALAWAAYRVGPHGGTLMPVLAPGPALAAVWGLAVSAGLGVYVQLSSSVSATLAVFGAPMALLLWLYLVLLGFLAGAELQAARTGPGSRAPA